MMYAATGDFAKSVPLARQAAALDPGNGEVLFMTGVVYESMHRRAEAIQWIGAALHHGYSIKSVEHDPDLASLRSDKNYLAMTASLR
jgi:hypothetical protein